MRKRKRTALNLVRKRKEVKRTPNLVRKRGRVSIPEKKYTDDSLRMIGYNDAQDENIVFEELPEAVRECAAYLEGYKLGLEKSKTKKAK